MKLLAPLSRVDEVEPLIRSGAEEIYCGLVPTAWVQTQATDDWLNRRNPNGANLHGLSELTSVVTQADAHDVPVFLTLNAHHYKAEQMPLILDMARRVAAVGVEALIISDISLILAIREADIDIRIHLSSLGTCTNAESAAMYAELGVDRIILPRHLSAREIGVLRDANVPVEYEVFLLNDGCAYEEGHCLTTHHYGPICMTPWQMDVQPLPGAKADIAVQWETNHKAYQSFLWHLNNCGSSNNEKGLPNGPCGLCALSEMQAMGVDSLKIVGREASPLRKLASVQLARAVLNRVRAGDSAEAVADKAKALRNTPELCSSTYMCYYR
ncbi:MAG: U32 family peptidase [Candidatus Sericytochromatia bacterium]|nr:U32 family peptidase [Candidatus Sericytochromatia bacterium]